MNKIEVIQRLKKLSSLGKIFTSIEISCGDVQALELAIKALESETALEVPVQEQSTLELVNKLSIREGVTKTIIDPHTSKLINIDGPTIVLSVID